MLNFFLVLLHHPLTGLLFAIWHFLSWSEHGTQIFDGFSQTMLTKMGLEAADFKDLNKAWYGKGAMAAQAPHPLTTTEPAPRSPMADTSDDFATMVSKPLLQYHGSSYKDSIVPTPPPQYPRYQKTTMVSTPRSQYPGYHEPNHPVQTTTFEPPPSQYPAPSWCKGAQYHVGKWHPGHGSLRLHYVCEKDSLPGVSRCSPGWHMFQGSCYRAVTDEAMDRSEAEKSCFRQESSLVQIGTQAENEFVQKLVGWNTAWIGLELVGSSTYGQCAWRRTTEGYSNFFNFDNCDNCNSFYPTGDCEETPKHAYMNDWNALCMPPPGKAWPANIPTDSVNLMAVVGLLVTLAIVALFSPFCFACVYKKTVSDRRQAVPQLDAAAVPAPTAEDFPFSLCGCFEDMDICCHAFWCNMTRAADTHHAAGTEKFLNIVLFWICCIVVGSVVGDPTGMLPGVIMAVGMTYKRRALKERLGIKAGSSCKDFLLWWCCGSCAIAQEARAIDQAAGVTVKCCCSIRRRASPANLVGPPVTAAGALAQPLQASPQIAVTSFPTVSQQQRQLPAYMVPQNVVAPQLSPQSAQPIQPIVAQVISIQPPAARFQ